MTEHELRDIQDRIANNKSKEGKKPSLDLFGKEIPEDAKDYYREILKAITKDKKYLFIKGNIKSKKNNYIIHKRYTGRSICCNAPYNKKTKICVKCGQKTRSGTRALINLRDDAKASQDHVARELAKRKAYFKGKGLLIIGVFFIRETKARFDFDNAITLIQDAFYESGIISDDSADKLITIPMGFIVNKKKTGLIIRQFDNDYFKQFLLKSWPIENA